LQHPDENRPPAVFVFFMSGREAGRYPPDQGKFMSLEIRIDDDWKAAMKAGDKARKDALSLLRAAIKQKRVDDKVEITDAIVVAVIEKMLKQRKDSITQYEAAQRQDLADAEKFEAGVLAGYMPQGLSAAEVEAIVAAAVAESGARGPADMGKVIALVKPKVAGRADMGEVSRRKAKRSCAAVRGASPARPAD
jgi:uncharacterized protein YqeY